MINEELEKILDSRVGLIKDMGSHALLAEGKRLRPLLFLLCCRLCDYAGEKAYQLSTIFEYIHVASLLHDDVLDNAALRRKKPSVNTIWGNEAAVLEGDFLYSKAFSIALTTGDFVLLDDLAKATLQMTEGQILELMHTDDWNTSKEEYFEIITSKTAVLISAACSSAGRISGSDDRCIRSLVGFGLNLGIAFQLIDDVLDYESTEERFGKPVGKDLQEGKITLPLIYALARVDEKEAQRLTDLYQDRQARQGHLEELIGFVRNSGALSRVRKEAHAYTDRAAQFMRSFEDSIAKRSLLELNGHISNRAY
jgi:octaprenyl-diphosphate synthase